MIVQELECYREEVVIPQHLSDVHCTHCSIPVVAHGELTTQFYQGNGSISLVNQCHYFGDMSQGFFDGQGQFNFPDGTQIFGHFSFNQLAQGKIIFPNGCVYEGELLHFQMHGQGKLKGFGFHYEGSFSRGVYSGTGKVLFDNGELYEGGFQEGLRHGVGTVLYPDGNR